MWAIFFDPAVHNRGVLFSIQWVSHSNILKKPKVKIPIYCSCGLSTATIEYSCLCVCRCVVCLCSCLSVCVHHNSKNNGSIHMKLDHIVEYENSSKEFDIGHCPIKVKVTV